MARDDVQGEKQILVTLGRLMIQTVSDVSLVLVKPIMWYHTIQYLILR